MILLTNKRYYCHAYHPEDPSNDVINFSPLFIANFREQGVAEMTKMLILIIFENLPSYPILTPTGKKLLLRTINVEKT